MFNKQLFEKYYTFEMNDKYIRLGKINNEKKHLDPFRELIYLSISIDKPQSKLSQDEIDRLISENKLMKTNSKEIYMNLLNLTEEEFYLKYANQDLRTVNYLASVQRNIGLVKSDSSDEDDVLKDSYEIDGYVNSSKIEIGKTEDQLWCSQYSIQTAIDDYAIIKHYFNRKPTFKMVSTADTLNDLDFKFKYKSMEYKIKFQCWECGRETHWLDVEGDFNKKLEGLEDKYCGC